MTNEQLIQALEAERSRLLGLPRRQQIQVLQQTPHGEFRAVIFTLPRREGPPNTYSPSAPVQRNARPAR